jgi:hypothetical protein
MLHAFLRCAHSLLCVGSWSVLLLAFLFASPASVLAQTITVQNGGTVTVENDGVWDLKGTTVDLGGTGSTASISETGGGRFANGQLTATRALNAPSARDVAGLGLQITASADLGNVDVTRGHAVQVAPNNNESIERYYDVNPSQNNSGLSAELVFSYNDAELNGRTESLLEFFKSTDSGSNWTEEGFDSRDDAANTVTLGGIESLSRWTLGDEDNPLPVELAAFEARANGQRAVLQWQTASETSNAGFEVQRQKEEEWRQVGYVESKASGGSATETKSYSYTATGLSVGTHQFRLKQVDLDGSSTLTDPVSVEVQMQEALRLNAPVPNPVRASATLSFAVKTRAETRITLYNSLGQQVRVVHGGTPQAGEEQRAQVDVSGLSSGTYFLRMDADGKTQTQRLTVVR